MGTILEFLPNKSWKYIIKVRVYTREKVMQNVVILFMFLYSLCVSDRIRSDDKINWKNFPCCQCISALFCINLPCIQQLITFISWIYVEYNILINCCLELLTVINCYVYCNTLPAVYSSRCGQNRIC
jgi:hypothetical protein